MSTVAATATRPQSSLPSPALTLRQVIRFWWPLAASWLLMGSELPAVSAILARLPDPKIHLAAYGVAFSLSLIVEAPIIMLLAASTALSKDWASYLKLRRFMMRVATAMTALHILIAFTPLFDLLMTRVIGLPPDLIEPTRLGLRIMTPWTWSIAYRRFNQGVLIRFDHTRSVGVGTAVRLAADLVVLAIGFLVTNLPGVVVGASAIIAGVVSEATYIGIRVQPILRHELKPAPEISPPLHFRAIIDFYLPLALTSLIMLIVQPIGTAALSHAPLPIESLAVWPVISGLIFIHRSISIALNEVVVALLERPNAERPLHRFTLILTFAATLPVTLIAFTPLAGVWFGVISGLSPDLAALAKASLPFALLLPALQPWISWHQGTLMVRRRTPSITVSVVLFVAVTSALLWAGVAWAGAPGVIIAWVAFSAGTLAQTVWLWLRSHQTAAGGLSAEGAAI